jgi:hypothetical protein
VEPFHKSAAVAAVFVFTPSGSKSTHSVDAADRPQNTPSGARRIADIELSDACGSWPTTLGLHTAGREALTDDILTCSIPFTRTLSTDSMDRALRPCVTTK